MKILNIGRDKDLRIFEDNSAVTKRMIEYGKLVEEIHVTVFTFKTSGLKVKKISPNVFVYPTNSSSKWFFLLDAIKIGKKIILDNKFVRGRDVLTAQDPFECGFVAWWISRKFRLPFQLQVHTDFLSPYFQTSLLQKIRVVVAKFLLPKASGVRVVSSKICNSIKNKKLKLRKEPIILPIRIDVESIEKVSSIDDHSNLQKLFPNFKFIVLMASRLTKEKRIGDALISFSKIVKKYPFSLLVIAGGGPEKNNLLKIISNLEVNKNVVLLGWRDDVSVLMKTANLFLSTSEYEGYGMTLVEAGLSGLPILSTKVGISDDILEHNKNSYLCSVGDTICIYDGLVKFIEDNPFRYQISQQILSDLKGSILPQEDYVDRYIGTLEETSKNI